MSRSGEVHVCSMTADCIALAGTLAHAALFMGSLQTVKTFEAALQALVAAGVELVEFDMGLLTAEGAEIEAELLLAYEMPRELSRLAHTPAVMVSLSAASTVVIITSL